LDKWENHPAPRDGDKPEDWLASTICAVNPGLEEMADEGLSEVEIPPVGKIRLRELFQAAPAYYFGADHVGRIGPQLGFLAKLLDSSMRLHVQAHPTAAFAREHLQSPWGKLEAYVILALRDESTAYIRLGFQRPPSAAEWRRIVLEQDIAAMDACFDPIPVKVGEVWLVPGGLAHAIGEGVLMLEVMEPSDLVVRCEFNREGVIVPPAARFMQTSVDLALQIFDYTPRSVAEVASTYKIIPRRISSDEELLIGSSQTECFSVTRITAHQAMALPTSSQLRLGVVASGSGVLTVEGFPMRLKPGACFILAASAPPGTLTVSSGEPLQILFCSPGRRD
jgi:mannose-6-phosphate isomerase